jgi:hypothetical protein
MDGALSELNNVGEPSTVGLKKLSKSSDDTFERRNKSYSKVLDAQIEWIRLHGQDTDSAETAAAYDKWKAKSAWHEKEFGW